DRHLDLRQLLADAQAHQQAGESANALAYRWAEHLATLDVSDVRSQPLAKAYDHASLLGHVLRAQARTAAIAPDRAPQRLEPFLRRHVRHALETLTQLGVLGLQLRLRREVLERAAAASSEVLALGSHTDDRRLDHLQQLGIIMLTVPARAAEANGFPWQRACDERGLACANDPLPLLRESGDASDLILPRHAGIPRNGAPCRRAAGLSPSPAPPRGARE